MTKSSNLNAHASRLALDAAYYDEKANATWELLNNIDQHYIDSKGSVQPEGGNTIVFTVQLGNKIITHLPMHLTDLTVVNNILMSLLSYYRSKYSRAKQELSALK